MKGLMMVILEWLLMDKVWGFCWKYVIREEDKWECICDRRDLHEWARG